MFVIYSNVVCCNIYMASSTLVNLIENSNNLSLAIKNKHWNFLIKEDKFLCIESCKSKGYGTKNHFWKHIFLHNLHVPWNTHRCSQNIVDKPCIQIFRSTTFLSRATRWQWTKWTSLTKKKNGSKMLLRLWRP